MADALREVADNVLDEATFLVFITLLAADSKMSQALGASPYGPKARGWENTTIDQFLEAAAEWGNASAEGLKYYEPPSNPWRRAAHILLAGKSYE